MRIGNAIKLIRLFQEMTQGEVADRMGLSRTMFVQLETGKANPSWNSLLGLAIAFDMKLSSIIEIVELLDEGHSPQVAEVQKLLVKKRAKKQLVHRSVV